MIGMGCDPVFVADGGWLFSDQAQQKVHWKLGLLAKQQLIGGVAGGLVDSGIVRKEQLWQSSGPFSLLFWWEGAQKIVERSVKALALPVSLWVVWGSPAFFYLVQFTQSFQ